MSKGNIFMGNASGKLADVVLYRNAGAQVARLRVRNPKNPRSEAQRIQRVLQSTNSKAYSILQPICNHAFEGKVGNTENQSAFMKANIARDRYRINVTPLGWRNLTNFNTKDNVSPIANNYIVSQGSLPEVQVGQGRGYISVGSSLPSGVTYKQLADNLGLEQGDQLTVLFVQGDAQTGTMTGLRLARVILDPSSHDMSIAFLDENGAVNSPNEKNEGTLSMVNVDGSIHISMVGSPVAWTIIASRYTATKWLRSTQRLYAEVEDVATLGDAVDSWIPETSSDKYLNQAEVIRLGGN